MLWIVLGIGAAITAYVVLGTLADRRLALTATSTDALPAAPAAPPVAAAPVIHRGDTAASAVPVPAIWREKLAAGKCACGEPLAIASDEGIRFDDRVLVVVRLECAACGHARSVYLEPATA